MLESTSEQRRYRRPVATSNEGYDAGSKLHIYVMQKLCGEFAKPVKFCRRLPYHGRCAKDWAGTDKRLTADVSWGIVRLPNNGMKGCCARFSFTSTVIFMTNLIRIKRFTIVGLNRLGERF